MKEMGYKQQQLKSMLEDRKNQGTKLLRVSDGDFQSFDILRLKFIKKTDRIINKKEMFSAITDWLLANFDEWTKAEKGQKNKS